MSSLHDTFRITQDHNIYANVVGADNKLTETHFGQILTYNIPNEYLEHYTGSLYKKKEGADYNEEIITDNKLLMGYLEMSNYVLLPVLLRMYYIINVIENNSMANIELKKDLLNILIKFVLENYKMDFNGNYNMYLHYKNIIVQYLEYDH